MDVELSWQTFACTGDILCYLDYRRQLAWQTFACTGDILCYLDYRRQLAQQRLTAPAGEKTDGYHCDPGPCPERDPV